MSPVDLVEAADKEAVSEIKRLRAFARAVMTAWPEGDLDGGALQEAAVAHGLLIPEVRAAPCAEDCACAEYRAEDEWADGVTCYRRVGWLDEEEEQR